MTSEPDDSISFDSNVLSYFLQANSGAYDPTTDSDTTLAAEKIAAYRLFLYGPQLWIVPSVLQESEAIRDHVKKEEHVRWILFNLREVTLKKLNEEDVAKRQHRYELLHPSGKLDCRAVAEAESFKLHRFVTFDRTLLLRLAGRTDRILIQSPTECWIDLAIPGGSSPRNIPANVHPLARAEWWRWW